MPTPSKQPPKSNEDLQQINRILIKALKDIWDGKGDCAVIIEQALNKAGANE